MLCHLFLASIISDEKPLSLKLFFLQWVMYHFSVAAFKVFSWSLLCLSLTVICLGMDFFSWSCSGVSKLLKSVGLCLLPNLENFQSLFLWLLFQPHPLSSLLLGLQSHQCHSFCYSPTSLWLNIFSLIFSLLFRLDNVYYSMFKFAGSFLPLLHSAQAFLLLFYYSSLKFHIWFFFISSIGYEYDRILMHLLKPKITIPIT